MDNATRIHLVAVFSAALLGGAAQAWPIDHRVTQETTGWWSHNVSLAISDTLIVGEIAIGLWEGGESRFGKTDWQAIDSSAVGGIISQTSKYIFTRSRPSQTDNPNKWFQGKGNYSFPSGEVTNVTAIVTPFILEYGHDYPATYALALLPLYTGAIRVKNWGHWQTDVLASWALGGITGYWAYKRESPLILSVMPHGIMVGLKTSF
ncbi:MAG: phosphatase PAP2 family protein [Betaproteobacteria bacterium]|nr:MAG: phosphatase PAP2 family protein [Betaproteobacteria bacterium]